MQNVRVKTTKFCNSVTQNDQSIPFFVISKLIEAVIKNKHVFCIYFQQDTSKENLSKLITRFDPKLVMKDAESNGMFDLLSRCGKWREDFKYAFPSPSEYGPNKLRKRELKGVRETQRKEAEASKHESSLRENKKHETARNLRKRDKRDFDKESEDEIGVDLSDISSESDDEPDKSTDIHESIRSDINQLHMYIDHISSNYV